MKPMSQWLACGFSVALVVGFYANMPAFPWEPVHDTPSLAPAEGSATYTLSGGGTVVTPGDQLILFDPMDPAHEIVQKTNHSDRAEQNRWTRLAIPGAPLNARAVILNVYGHARGFSAARTSSDGAPVGAEPRVTFTARRCGSNVAAENYSFAVYATGDEAFNVGQNTFYVPLDDNGAIEYRYQVLMSGGHNDSGHFRVYVQGFVVRNQ